MASDATDPLDLSGRPCLEQRFSPLLMVRTTLHDDGLVVQVARHYGTPLEIALDGEVCPASSLMALILVGGRHPRPKEIRVTGDARALRDLDLLFQSGLGEGGRALPAELDYLRTSA